ncbi:MAG: alpha/beta hydrolase [Holosporales bacterium]|jgi:alpha/beta superfamily hydrolase|nr:alpha/beta hydrolase [Holosporales bacterium]
MSQITFNGPAGRLEGVYHHGACAKLPVALVLHPHPLQGGTMHNRVTYTLYRAFAKQGLSVMRFNFRGVGSSEGSFDSGEGEVADAAAALDWLQSVNPKGNPLLVAGFSFGAWVAMQLLMRRPEVAGFISVSPPANLYDFNFLAPCPVSGMIVCGKKDDIVDEQSVDALVTKLNSQKGIQIDYRVLPQADHFYTNHLDTIYQYAVDYVTAAQQGQSLAYAANW